MTIRVDVKIAAPPDVVWDAVEPIERHVEWMADAEAISFTSPQTRGTGTTFDCVTRVGPIRLTDRMRVTEWEPGSVMGIEHRGVVTGRGRFTLRPLDGEGTEFIWTEQLTFPWWMGGRAGALVARPVFVRIWRRNLRRLKDQIESNRGMP